MKSKGQKQFEQNAARKRGIVLQKQIQNTIHGLQKVTNYISSSGVKVYETIQYDVNSNDWYIVGDTTTLKRLAHASVNHHNLLLKLKQTISRQNSPIVLEREAIA